MAFDEDQDEETQEQETSNSGGDDGGSSGEEMSAGDKAEQEAKEREEATEKVKQMEEDPPNDIEDWPSDKAKYITFGGAEGEEGYDEAVTRNLGPSEVRHHEDGSVTVEGEEVDDPDEYKGEPIPGGPTDPNVPDTQKGTAASDDEDDS